APQAPRAAGARGSRAPPRACGSGSRRCRARRACPQHGTRGRRGPAGAAAPRPGGRRPAAHASHPAAFTMLPVNPLGQDAAAPRRRLGVALGGGSARGYAHLGALASLERHGLAPDLVVGTSFGAVVGALYATGRDLADILAEAEAMRRRDVFPHIADFGLHRAALFGG